MRNYLVTGEVVPVQGNTALMIWAGNNPHADGGMVMPSRLTWQDGPPPDGPDYTWWGLSLSESNARYLAAVERWLREDPAAFAENVLRKLQRLFGFAKAGPEASPFEVPWAVQWAHWSVLGMALVGLLAGARHVRSLALFYFVAIYGILTVLVFSGGTRYLMSIMVSVVVFAGVGAEWLLRKGLAVLSVNSRLARGKVGAS
jgi:hypothetical protein